MQAAAMIRVDACWSRMSSRFALVKNGPLEIDNTMKRTRNGKMIPPRRARPRNPVRGSRRMA